MSFGLGAKLIGFFLLLIVVIGGNFVFFLNAEDEAAKQHDWVMHTHEVLEASERFLGKMRDAETGQRGYLLTNDPAYLEPYDIGVVNAEKDFSILRELTQDNHLQQSRLDAIHPLMLQKLRELAETIDLARQGRHDDAMAVVLSGRGKSLMDDVRDLIADFRNEEHTLLKLRTDEYAQAKQQMMLLFAVEGTLLIVLIVGLSIQVQRTVVQPLNHLTNSAERLGAGEALDLPETSRDDELGKLAKAFSNMHRDIAERTEDLLRLARYEKSYGHILAACSSTHDLSGALKLGLAIHASYHSSPASAVFLYNEADGKLHRVADFGTSEDLQTTISPDDGLIGQVFTDNDTAVITTDHTAGFQLNTGMGEINPTAIVFQPITYRDNALGVLVLAYTSQVDDQVMKYIENLGSQFGVTAVNSSQYDSLQQLTKELEESRRQVMAERDEAVLASITDPLTGVHNRGYLELELERLKSVAKRYSHDLALIILDIDHFKRINDTFGHTIGDEVLVALGGVLKQHTRVSDLVARYGGEEFVIVVPETHLQETRDTAEKLRHVVENLEIPALNGEKVTISLGVAVWAGQEESTALIARADEALYRAKEGGRNQVCVAKEA